MGVAGMANKRFWKRGWFWSSCLVLLIVVFILLFINHIIEYALEKGLSNTGFIEVSTGDIRFNVVTNSLAISDFEIAGLAIESLRIDHVQLDMRLRSLLSKTIDIEEINIHKLDLTIDMSSQAPGLLRTAGHSTLFGKGARASSGSWDVVLGTLYVEDSRVLLDDDMSPGVIGIDRAVLSDLELWKTRHSLSIDYLGSFKDRPIEAELVLERMSEGTAVMGHIECSGLPVAPGIDPKGSVVPFFSFILDLDVDVEALFNRENALDLKTRGLLGVSNGKVKTDMLELELTRLEWDGEGSLLLKKNISPEWNIAGALAVSDMSLNLLSHRQFLRMIGMSWQGSAGMNEGPGGGYPSAEGTLALEEAFLDDVESASRIFAVNEVSLAGVKYRNLRDFDIDGLVVEELRFLQDIDVRPGESRTPALIDTGRIRIDAAAYRDLNRLETEKVYVKGLALQRESMGLRLGSTVLSGVRVKITDDIVVSSVAVNDIASSLTLDRGGKGSISLDTADLSGFSLSNLRDLDLRYVNIGYGEVKFGPNRLYFESVRTRNMMMRGKKILGIPVLSVDNLALVEYSSASEAMKGLPGLPLSMGKILVFDTEVSTLRDLHIGSVQVMDLDTVIVRTGEGRFSAAGFSPGGEGVERGDGRFLFPGGYTLSVSRVGLERGSRIVFIDENVVPEVRLGIEVGRISLVGIGTPEETREIHFDTVLKLEPYTRSGASGWIRPYQRPMDVDLSLSISDFDLPVLSPYMRKHLGYEFSRGSMDYNVTMTIEEGKIEGDSTLVLRNADVSQTGSVRSSEEVKINAQQLERSLKILRDKNGTVVIELPFSGDLKDPKFELRQIMQTALTRGLRGAVSLTLGVALWPFSGIYLLTTGVLSEVNAVQFESIYYQEGDSSLSRQHREYLGRVAQLLRDRPDIELSICGVASEQERPRNWSDERLYMLARVRAETVRGFLVDEEGINQSRLFICTPKIESPGDAEGRVDLQI
jgi:hypothetical protein